MMLATILAFGMVADLGVSARMEEYGASRVIEALVNGQKRVVAVEPVNYLSSGGSDLLGLNGEFLNVSTLGFSVDRKLDDAFFSSEEAGRTVSDKKVSMFMGEEYFVNRLVGVDYWQETIHVFDARDREKAIEWVKDGRESKVYAVPLRRTESDVVVADHFKIGAEKYPVMLELLGTFGDQFLKFEPAKYDDLWEMAGDDGMGGYVLYNRAFWREVSFGGIPLPYYVGLWTKTDDNLPGVTGTLLARDLGSSRVLYDAGKLVLHIRAASAEEQMMAAVSAHGLRIPVRILNGQLVIGRIPRLEDDPCNGGTIVAVDSLKGSEIVAALKGSESAQRAMVKDLVLRSRQRMSIEVLCLDGKTRTFYQNSLFEGG